MDNTFSMRKINRQHVLYGEDQQTTYSLGGRATDNTFSTRKFNEQHVL
jgi:hypothetical protein